MKSPATAQDLYLEMHRVEIAPRLRDLGFKGTRGSYVLPDDEFWQVVSFQKDKYSSAEWIRFTVNLARTAKDEWALEAGRSARPRRHPGGSIEAVGYWARLGNVLAPLGHDRWWEIAPGRSTASVGAEVVAALDQFGIPWLRGGPDPYRPTQGRGRR